MQLQSLKQKYLERRNALVSEFEKALMDLEVGTRRQMEGIITRRGLSSENLRALAALSGGGGGVMLAEDGMLGSTCLDYSGSLPSSSSSSSSLPSSSALSLPSSNTSLTSSSPSSLTCISQPSARSIQMPISLPLLILDKSESAVLEQIASNPVLHSVSVGGWRCTLQSTVLSAVSEDEFSKLESSLSEYSLLPRHPNIVGYLFHTYSTNPLTLQLYSETVGLTLEHCVEQRRAFNNHFTIDDIHSILVHIASGLAFLHQHGVIHRSLSPTTLFVEPDIRGAPKRVAIGSLLTARNSRFGQAVTKSFEFGPFVAPELFSADRTYESYNYDVDVYSFGMLIFYLLTGTVPYQKTPEIVIIRNLQKGIRLQLPKVQDTHLKTSSPLYEILAEMFDVTTLTNSQQRPSSILLKQALHSRESILGLQKSSLSNKLTRLQGKDIGGFEFASRSSLPLFDQFLVIGTSPAAAIIASLKSIRQPEVLYAFPQQAPMDPHLPELTFPDRLSVFKGSRAEIVNMFPDEKALRSPERSFVVRISSEGGNYYGFCVKDVGFRDFLPFPWEEWRFKQGAAPPRRGTVMGMAEPDEPDVLASERCYLFVSRLPFFSLFFQLLYDIQKAVREMGDDANKLVDVQDYLSDLLKGLLAQPVPPQNEEAEFTLVPTSKEPIHCVIPKGHPNRFVANFSLPLLFKTLSVDDLLMFWKFLLIEQKMVIQTTQPGLLSGLLFSILPLLSPFVFQGIFLPIVPRHLYILCDSPVPYLLGFTGKPPTLDKDVAIFNLDTKTIIAPPSMANIPLPSFIQTAASQFLVDQKNSFALAANSDLISTGANANLNERLSEEISAEFRSLHHRLIQPITKHVLSAEQATNFYRDFDRFDAVLAQLQTETGPDFPFFKLLLQTQSFAFWLQTEFSASLERAGPRIS